MEHGIDDPLLLRRGTPGSEIHRNRLIDLDDRRFLINDVELMLVGELVVARPQFSNGFIMVVHDRSMAVTMTIARVMVSFEAEEDVFALPASLLEVGGPNGVISVARPDQLPIVSEDVRSRLTGSMHCPCVVQEPGERGDKDISLVHIWRGGDGNVQSRRSQVGPRLKLPVRCRQGQQRGGCDPQTIHVDFYERSDQLSVDSFSCS